MMINNMILTTIIDRHGTAAKRTYVSDNQQLKPNKNG